jgi:Spy/CpxP family protein refolding chaperone
MLKAVSTVLVLAVSLIVVDSLAAQERHREGPRGGQGGWERIEAMVKNLNLTEEQKAKVAELKKEYAPKFKEATAKVEAIATAEQKKARDEAVKAAKAAGKKGPEVMEAARDAMKLTDEQKTKMQEGWKAMQTLGKEARDKVVSILTPEQKEQLKKAREERRGHRPDMN